MKKWLLYIFLIGGGITHSQDFEVSKAAFNSKYDEYAAGLLKDAVVFSSNKKPQVLVTYLDDEDNYYSNLYVSKENAGIPAASNEIFSKEISSDLNEGSLCFSADGNILWYTSNIQIENQKIRRGFEFKLGIFRAEKIDGVWQKTGEFPYNSKNQEYNIAHPSISKDGDFMVFSSDMTGGEGSSDIWITRLIEGKWQVPEPLPKSVNTDKTELFPFLDEKNTLYYSTNAFSVGGDLDIYKVSLNELVSGKPSKLPAPLNSEFDDFGFMIREGGESGYLSSDREEDFDNVYSFKYNYPTFVECEENFEPALCFFFEETNMVEIDTLPFAYIWDFGDGNQKKGFTVEHCYADSGTYDISLNVIDSITGVNFASVNNMQLTIEFPNQPYITSKDTLIVNNDYLFSSKDSEFIWDEIEEWFWEMGDGNTLRGEEIYYSYSQPGIFYMTLGALGVMDESGIQNKICVYKELIVIESEERLKEIREEERLAKEQALIEEELALNETEENSSHEETEDQEAVLSEDKTSEVEEETGEETLVAESAENVINYDYMTESKIDADSIKAKLTEEIIESTYFVELLKNDEPISLEDPYFEGIRHEITERFVSGDSSFIYSVGQAEDIFALWDVYQEVLDSGYISAIVKQERLKNFKEDTETIGYSNPLEEQEVWNRTITSFANIQFESNSSRISDESMAGLDYIALMMEIEEEFTLVINAFTDDKGNAEYNLTLSKRRADMVKRYLIRKGVSADRLLAKGFGEENPISDNLTELGRAVNRRVEFKIISNMFK